MMNSGLVQATLGTFHSFLIWGVSRVGPLISSSNSVYTRTLPPFFQPVGTLSQHVYTQRTLTNSCLLYHTSTFYCARASNTTTFGTSTNYCVCFSATRKFLTTFQMLDK